MVFGTSVHLHVSLVSREKKSINKITNKCNAPAMNGKIINFIYFCEIIIQDGDENILI